METKKDVRSDISIWKKPFTVAFLSSVALFSGYLAALTVGESSASITEEFAGEWYFIIPLVTGFGLQMGLYSHIRNSLRGCMKTIASPTVTTAGGISATSMVACCIHHITDVLPIIGLTAGAALLSTYQPLFLSGGVVSNIVGVTVMLSIMHEHGLLKDRRILKAISEYNVKRIRNGTIIISTILIATLVVFSAIPSPSVQNENIPTSLSDLPALEKTQNGIAFQVKPSNFSYNKPVVFEVAMDTHQGSLDFNPAKIATLEADGRLYKPQSWDGSGPGGHHRSGILTFPQVGEAKYLELTFKDIDESGSNVVFQWGIRSESTGGENIRTLGTNVYAIVGLLAAILAAFAYLMLTSKTVRRIRR